MAAPKTDELTHDKDYVCTQIPHISVGQVIPISENLPTALKEMLQARLFFPGLQNRVLPSPLLSDYEGLKIWSQITHMPNYYQTEDEIDILEENAREVAKYIVPGCTLLDIGCGDVRKIKPLLDILETQQKHTNYFALDLSRDILIEAMAYLIPFYKYVHCFGLWGTFDDGVKWAESIAGQRFFLSLGSVMGNDFFEVAVERLRPWANLMRPDDRLLLGMDATTNLGEIWNSYHDPEGLFERFMRNGLSHSNQILNEFWYRPEDWDVLGILTTEPIMHRFVFRARRKVECQFLGLQFDADDEIDCYEAFKYGPETMRKQFDSSGLKEVATWVSPSKRIHQYLLHRIAN